jgi:uncharacterized protein YcfJ
MKRVLIAAALVAMTGALPLAPANAAGCLKGAMVGGVAGHYVGHHGLLGAGVGCLIGRHHANKTARQSTTQDNYTTANTYRTR